jgi:hypothetical protein
VIDTLFPNWSNPEAVAAVVGLRVLCNVVIFWCLSNAVGVRSVYTTIVGGLIGFSTVTTMMLLTTNWFGHPVSYFEQLSQLIIIGISLVASVRCEFDLRTVVLLLACSGAAYLLLPMTIIYAEIFVAP